MCSLLQEHHPPPQGTFVMTDEPTHLYYLYYAESIVYIRVHSQCYTFHIFEQIYNGLDLLLPRHVGEFQFLENPHCSTHVILPLKPLEPLILSLSPLWVFPPCRIVGILWDVAL